MAKQNEQSISKTYLRNMKKEELVEFGYNSACKEIALRKDLEGTCKTLTDLKNDYDSLSTKFENYKKENQIQQKADRDYASLQSLYNATKSSLDTKKSDFDTLLVEYNVIERKYKIVAILFVMSFLCFVASLFAML